uniref:Uncharacterized protein n=1 Tax=Rhizophora mucronata TaxID=61149 RepID=A0A2P2NIB1_RHIMU
MDTCVRDLSTSAINLTYFKKRNHQQIRLNIISMQSQKSSINEFSRIKQILRHPDIFLSNLISW